MSETQSFLCIMWRGMFAIPVIVAGLYNGFLSSILKQWVKSSSDSLVDTKNMESFNPWECVCFEVLIYLLHGDRTHLNCVFRKTFLSSATESESCPTWPLCFFWTLLLSYSLHTQNMYYTLQRCSYKNRNKTKN